MSESSDVSLLGYCKASDYNNLRKDAINTSSGHDHDGINSKSFILTYDNLAIKIQSGTATISSGTKQTAVVFPVAFVGIPAVVITKKDNDEEVYMNVLVASGFTFQKTTNATSDQTYEWIAVYIP
jgi:hypothetical protein